ncbi:hypothetical protein EDD22DRAFT_851783 [Suillus occidentalis]|nr:hypothetical protein EDD22DRAFT_851783 [Suillus occidentalis]
MTPWVWPNWHSIGHNMMIKSIDIPLNLLHAFSIVKILAINIFDSWCHYRPSSEASRGLLATRALIVANFSYGTESERISFKKRNLNCGENTDREMNAGAMTYVRRVRREGWLWVNAREIRASVRCERVQASLGAQDRVREPSKLNIGMKMPVGHGWMDGRAVLLLKGLI